MMRMRMMDDDDDDDDDDQHFLRSHALAQNAFFVHVSPSTILPLPFFPRRAMA